MSGEQALDVTLSDIRAAQDALAAVPAPIADRLTIASERELDIIVATGGYAPPPLDGTLLHLFGFPIHIDPAVPPNTARMMLGDTVVREFQLNN